ncbi:MAG: PEGA domain-containing protein, partial [Massilia sp.]
VESSLDPSETVVAPPASGPAVMSAAAPASEPAPAVSPITGEPLVGAVAKPEAKRAPPSELASYKLLIKPWGTVYVDGKERGVSPPLKKLTLAPGKHKIRVVNPSFPEYVTNVELEKNKSGTIEHDFSAAHR